MGREKKFNDKEKWCNRCERWRPLGEFQLNANTASGRQCYCADCQYGKKRRRDPGFVYVIGNAEVRKFKIGVSANPEKRLGVMRMHSPIPIEIIQKIQVKDMQQAEREFHTRLAAKHSHGEWFNLSLEEARNLR